MIQENIHGLVKNRNARRVTRDAKRETRNFIGQFFMNFPTETVFSPVSFTKYSPFDNELISI